MNQSQINGVGESCFNPGNHPEDFGFCPGSQIPNIPDPGATEWSFLKQ
jgi:hypothetical protein